MFDPSHVVVAGGMLSLLTMRDAANGGGWATGGVCQCGIGRTYGAYFVRSRLTGAGVDEVQMLWPVAHVWPPEIDFNETGNRVTTTAWYVHFRSSGHQIARTLRINLTRWHTWGVRWTPRLITFTVDGDVWGVVRSPSVIPHERMTLDLSQQTWCGIAPECPQRPLAMQVDWVAEYAPT
jgi:beta-glucanase (GH16 family)